MMAEIGKSFRKIFQDRLTSPLYGSFILSWLIWNWKIIYLTIFISQDLLKPQTKIDYILSNYVNWLNLTLYPFLSAVALIAVIPLLANQAYRIHLYYERKRRTWKEEFDKGQRLTIEQSAQLRNEGYEQDIKYQKQLDAKDSEIKVYKQQTDSLADEKTKIQEQFNQLYQRTNKFNILYATYGKYENQKNVTDIVKKIIENRRTFLINNSELGGDPLFGTHKILQIIYLTNGSVREFTAKEYYELELNSENIFVAHETNESRSVYQAEMEQMGPSSIEYLFPGRWRLEYSGKYSGQEEVEIKDGNKYFAKAQGETSLSHVFNLENISIDLNIGRISFEKNSVYSAGRRTIDNLKIVEIGKQYVGTEENGEVNVSYQKIG
jgi:hypothetical protein